MKPYYNHAGITIYHGDCRDILPELEPVDLVLTDPPYGHNNNNNGDLISRREAALGRGDYVPERDNRPIVNDGKEANEIFKEFIIQIKDKLKPGCCCCCCCCGGGPDPMFARWSLIMDEILEFCQMIVWDKGPMGMGWRYRRSYETILVAYKKGAPMKWYDTSKKIENIIRPISKIIPSASEHPTIKPVALMSYFITLHSQEANTILDPFMGSGTTLVAAQSLGRRAIGIEIEQKYCDIAIRRLKQQPLPLCLTNTISHDTVDKTKQGELFNGS